MNTMQDIEQHAPFDSDSCLYTFLCFLLLQPGAQDGYALFTPFLRSVPMSLLQTYEQHLAMANSKS